jgi:HlyD family secretion protein
MFKTFVVVTLMAIVIMNWGLPEWKRYQAQQIDDKKNEGITSFGNVDIRQVALAFRVDGRLKKLVLEEGDVVQAGDLIGELDQEPYEEEVALRSADLAAARANLQRLEAGFRSQEIEIAKATVAEREVTLTNLQREYERHCLLVSNGFISRQSYDDVKTRRDEAQARLNSAREELDLRREGTRKEEIAHARAQVESQEAQLELARTKFNDTRLIAPSSGVVLTRVLEPGSIARMGQTVITISLTDPIWVQAYIAEPDLGKIHPGMKAFVYTDSRPDQPYEGQIGYISPKAEFTPKTVETSDLRTRLVYRFRVVVKNPDAGLRQGMPVTVKIFPMGNPVDSGKVPVGDRK